MSDPTTTGVINEVFANNLDVIVSNFGAVQGTSANLLLGLATIEVLLFLYGALLNPDEHVLKKFMEKLTMVFFVALLTFNWGTVAGFMRGYIGGGGAGIGGGNSMITSMNPAYIASDGLDKVSVIFTHDGQRALMEGDFFNDSESAKRKQERAAKQKERKKEQSWAQKTFDEQTGLDSSSLNTESMIEGLTDAGTQIGTMIIVGLIFCFLAILIVLVHFYVALQLFVLTIDWYLTVAITNLLVPFAVNKHTSSLATAAFQAVVRKSVQLGVMMAVLGIFGNTIQGLGLGPQPTMVDILSLLLGSLTMAFMVKNIPQIAGSIFSGGGGTIDVGSVMSGAAASVAGRAMGAMTGGAGVALGAASSVAGSGARMAGDGALKAGKFAGGKVLEGGKALSGEIGSRAGALMKSEDPGRGGRDAEPKSISELHESHMNESHHVQNHVDRASSGEPSVMSVDAAGNAQGKDRERPEPEAPQDQAYRGGLDVKQALPAVSGLAPVAQTQAMHGVEHLGADKEPMKWAEGPATAELPAVPQAEEPKEPSAPAQTQAMHGVQEITPPPVPKEPEAPKTQAMHGVARTRALHSVGEEDAPAAPQSEARTEKMRPVPPVDTQDDSNE